MSAVVPSVSRTSLLGLCVACMAPEKHRQTPHPTEQKKRFSLGVLMMVILAFPFSFLQPGLSPRPPWHSNGAVVLVNVKSAIPLSTYTYPYREGGSADLLTSGT